MIKSVTRSPGEAEDASLNWLSGGGEMGALIRSMDWSTNPLGRPDEWPQSLKTAVSLCLSSTFPISIVWGPEMIQLYNDAYRPICGASHPGSMGQRFWTTWESARPAVGGVIEKAASGEGSYIENQRMFLERNGYLEEAFMTFSFSPIRDEAGMVGGLFHPITETTERMLSGRRTQFLRDLAVQLGDAKNLQQVFDTTCRFHKAMELDVPFIIFYEKQGPSFEMKALAGIDKNLIVKLSTSLDKVQPSSDSSIEKMLVPMETLGPGFGVGPYQEPPHQALLMPIRHAGHDEATAFALVGVSSRRAFDDDYRNFYETFANALNTAFSSVYTLGLEQRRARELAQLDQAKTTFFSNISHELRTPLTLMLGPLEDRLLALEPHLPEYKSTELIHRNGQRLLKLVNGLLDFSRIEAGRMQARFSPIELFSYTKNLAYVFRELIEKAGLSFSIEGKEFSEPVYVDPEMWERVILNLLSNAVKYTLEGGIRIVFEETPYSVKIIVKDSGIGIPAHEMPRLFERFHRVMDARGRTFEGTGIGLSLIHELVRMHGGALTAESQEHAGSSFIVELKKGMSHLDPQFVIGKVEPSASQTAVLHLQEMAGWIEGSRKADATAGPRNADVEPSPGMSPAVFDGRILIVDDNHDMRNYIRSLMEPHFEVFLARDGSEALRVLDQEHIDLVISDVMMPVMNGFELLRQLRAHSRLCATPFIMLSARAGEEARVEGFDAGADDYLVKPFSARELLARVSAVLQASRIRAEANRILQDRDKRMLAAFEHASVGMVLMNRDYQVLDMNHAFCQLTGYSAYELTGLPILQINHVDHHKESKRLFAALESGEVPGFTLEKRLLRKGGDTCWVQSSVSALTDSTGRLEYFVAVVQDISARKSAEQSAEAARRAAEIANETKSLFLANVSHEVRTPLGIIQGFAELLFHEAGLGGEHAHYLNVIQRNALQLGSLIDDVLDLSKVEADQMQLLEQNFSPCEMLEGLRENFKPQAEGKGIGLFIEKSGPVPDQILSDDNRVRQILTNIIGNAIKFTANGHVRVVYRTVEEADGHRALKFSIHDTGIGLSEKEQERLFQAFSQADASISRSYGGTGLGLSLSRKLARLLGGDLFLESSTPGKGSVFVFQLKLKAVPHTKVSESENLPLKKLGWYDSTRILIVDDSSDNRLLITRILKSMGAGCVETAADGNEGVRLTLQMGFDVVFMDVQMPEVDGFQAVQTLRHEGYQGRVVALTAHAMQGYREKCLDAGFDDYLSKPISREKLQKSLEPVLRR